MLPAVAGATARRPSSQWSSGKAGSGRPWSPTPTRKTLQGAVRTHVLPASTIFTDGWPAYNGLDRDYVAHHRIRHSSNGLRGVYHAVSTKYLQNYLDEYCFRYNARNVERPMFWLILDRVQKEALASS